MEYKHWKEISERIGSVFSSVRVLPNLQASYTGRKYGVLEHSGGSILSLSSCNFFYPHQFKITVKIKSVKRKLSSFLAPKQSSSKEIFRI